jgi:uncharacterized membrane protein YfcA
MLQNEKFMTSQLIAIIVAMGFVAGMLSGLIGVGGGIVLVPALVYFLNYSQHQAQGTSLGVLTFPVVIVAFLKYYYDLKPTGNAIEFKVILLLGLGFLVGGFAGSSLALKLDKDLLKKVFAVILFYTGFKMLSIDPFGVAINMVKKIF